MFSQIAHKCCELVVIICKYAISNITNLAEDNSYHKKDRNKFSHWYQKWASGRILILCSLAIEVLSPGKLFSKTFQTKTRVRMLILWKLEIQ